MQNGDKGLSRLIRKVVVRSSYLLNQMDIDFSVCRPCSGSLSDDNVNMRGSKNVCQMGSNSDNGFFVFLVEKRDIKIPLEAGHVRPACKTPFKWRFAGVQMMAQH